MANKIKVKCEICKSSFMRWPCEIKENKNNFCSRECYYAWFRLQKGEKSLAWRGGGVALECIICGNIFSVRQCRIAKEDPKFCSRKCMGIGRSRYLIGENSCNWKGGKYIDSSSYFLVKMQEHPNAFNTGYVFEHRLVMEKALGRYLTLEEVVHHIDGNKQNNNIENLMLFANDSEHHKYHWHKLETYNERGTVT